MSSLANSFKVDEHVQALDIITGKWTNGIIKALPETDKSAVVTVFFPGFSKDYSTLNIDLPPSVARQRCMWPVRKPMEDVILPRSTINSNLKYNPSTRCVGDLVRLLLF